jgi:SAM-dependent methyltransferase
MREDFYAEYFRIEDRHWWFIGRRRIVLALLAAHLSRREGGGRRILDLGCGTGTMLAHLRRFGEVQGVDADERAVKFCRSRGEDRVQLLRARTLPFPDHTFDLVTALDVLEHIEDDEGALQEVARVLRPGGTLLATVPAYGWMWGAQDEISHHFRRYTAGQLEKLICRARFETERLTYFNTILFPPIAAIRVARRVWRRQSDTRSDFEMTQPGVVNRMLSGVFSSEARWLRRRDLPVGVSLLAVATTPE